MPRKTDTISLGSLEDKMLDRRRKLTPEQRAEIRLLHVEGKTSQRSLASMYGVSRRTIQFIVSPEKLAQNKERRLERGGWRQYYDKTTHAEAVKEHRQYKKEVMSHE